MFAVNAQPADNNAVKTEEDTPDQKLDVKADAEHKPKMEIKQEVKQPIDGPVSKWTMVDYDNEDSVFPGVQ